jgi:hypothetical protein
MNLKAFGLIGGLILLLTFGTAEAPVSPVINLDGDGDVSIEWCVDCGGAGVAGPAGPPGAGGGGGNTTGEIWAVCDNETWVRKTGDNITGNINISNANLTLYKGEIQAHAIGAADNVAFRFYNSIGIEYAQLKEASSGGKLGLDFRGYRSGAGGAGGAGGIFRGIAADLGEVAAFVIDGSKGTSVNDITGALVTTPLVQFMSNGASRTYVTPAGLWGYREAAPLSFVHVDMLGNYFPGIILETGPTPVTKNPLEIRNDGGSVIANIDGYGGADLENVTVDRLAVGSNTMDNLTEGDINASIIYYDALQSKSPHMFNPDESGYTRFCIKDKRGYWNLIYWDNGMQTVVKDSYECEDKNDDITVPDIKAPKTQREICDNTKGGYWENGQCRINPYWACIENNGNWNNDECIKDSKEKEACIMNKNEWVNGQCKTNPQSNCLKDRSRYWDGSQCVSAEVLNGNK